MDIYTVEITTSDIVAGEIIVTVVSEASGIVNATAVFQVNTSLTVLYIPIRMFSR